MPILSGILSALGGPIVNLFLDKAMGAFEAYFKKEISIEELRSRVQIAMLDTFKEIEKAHAESLTRTYDSFMKAAVQSPIMQRMWALTVGSQLFVLLWYQLGVPFLCYYVGNKTCYPSAGTSIEWAYLLLAGCLGMGAVMLRAGPGAGNIANTVKGLTGR